MVASQHYYSENQNSEFLPFKINVNVGKDSFSIYSSAGIFSKDELDSASKLLIESFPKDASKNASFLDLGCGNGVIGISLLRQNKLFDATFSDTNERALELVKMNLKANNLNILNDKINNKITDKIIKSNAYEKIKDSFDFILTNPPYAAGRVVCYLFIDGAIKHLKKNGKLMLVARHNKGGEQLMKRMFETFGNVETVSKKSGFRVYVSENKL